MKKLIVLALILIPFISFGAIRIVQELKFHEFMASIQTEDGKSLKVYKIEDGNVNCYVPYFTGFTNGNQTGISCVKVK